MASRSTSHTSSSSSAVLEPTRASGSWSRQVSYSACRARSSARRRPTAAAATGGPAGAGTVRTGFVGGAALTVPALPLGAGHGHRAIGTPLRDGRHRGGGGRNLAGRRGRPRQRPERSSGPRPRGRRGPGRRPGRPPTTGVLDVVTAATAGSPRRPGRVDRRRRVGVAGRPSSPCGGSRRPSPAC